MAVSKRTRFEVLRRDGFTCRYCRNDSNPLTVDHVVPVALGGTDTPDNLVACCRDCNTGKASIAPDGQLVADVEADAARWAAARKRAAEKLAVHHDRWSDEIKQFFAEWKLWDKGLDYLPFDYDESINRWLDAGLTYEQIDRAQTIALMARGVKSDRVFTYMAGVLRNWLIDLDIATKAELARGDDDG